MNNLRLSTGNVRAKMDDWKLKGQYRHDQQGMESEC